MAVANGSLPLVITSRAGFAAYAVVIGACTGALISLVLPLAVSASTTSSSSGTTVEPAVADASAADASLADASAADASAVDASLADASAMALPAATNAMVLHDTTTEASTTGDLLLNIYSGDGAARTPPPPPVQDPRLLHPPSEVTSPSVVSGLLYSTLAVGISAGPTLAGALRDATGSYAWGFVSAGAFSAAAALVSAVDFHRAAPPRAP